MLTQISTETRKATINIDGHRNLEFLGLYFLRLGETENENTLCCRELENE